VQKKQIFSMILAVLGTVLVWLPVLLPLISGLTALARRSSFQVDYLLPAEFFPVVLVGALLLLWAALRLHALRAWVSGALAGIVLIPLAGGLIGALTGLASGETAEGGWETTLIFGAIALYILAIVILGIIGILLIMRTFRHHPSAAAEPAGE